MLGTQQIALMQEGSLKNILQLLADDEYSKTPGNLHIKDTGTTLPALSFNRMYAYHLMNTWQTLLPDCVRKESPLSITVNIAADITSPIASQMESVCEDVYRAASFHGITWEHISFEKANVVGFNYLPYISCKIYISPFKVVKKPHSKMSWLNKLRVLWTEIKMILAIHKE